MNRKVLDCVAVKTNDSLILNDLYRAKGKILKSLVQLFSSCDQFQSLSSRAKNTCLHFQKPGGVVLGKIKHNISLSFQHKSL